jgi:hypothetical protein
MSFGEDIMFSCTIKKENTEWFKSVIKTISTIVDEINIEISEKGLIFRTLDRSHIMFLFLKLGKEWFKDFEFTDKTLNEYSVTVEELYNVFNKHAVEEGIDIDLFKVGILSLDIVTLRRPSGAFRITRYKNVFKDYQKARDKKDFWIDTSEFDKYLNLLNEESDIKLSGNLNLIDFNSKDNATKTNIRINKVDRYDGVPKPPELSLLTFVPTFKVFKNIIETLKESNISDKVYLEFKNRDLNFHMEGDKKIDLSIPNIRLDKDLKVNACYSFGRICKSVNQLKDVSGMTLEFNDDQPIQLSYYNNVYACFRCLIAPRIEAEVYE